MADPQRIPVPTPKAQPWQNHLPQILTALLLASILLVIAVVPLLATNWVRIPFIGSFLGQTMLVSPARPAGLEATASPDLPELALRGQLVLVNGQVFNGSRDLEIVLYRARVGDTARLTFALQDGTRIERDVTLQRFPSGLRVSLMLLPVFVALIYLLGAAWVFWLHNRHAQGRTLALLLAAVALVLAIQFDRLTTHRLAWMWAAGFGLIGAAFFDLGFVFSRDDPLQTRLPRLRFVAYGVAVLLTLLAAFWLTDLSHPRLYLYFWGAAYLFAGVGAVFCIWRVTRWLDVAPPVERDLVRLLLYAALFSFGPLLVWLLLSLVFPNLRFTPYLFLLVAVFPLVTGYAARRERLFRVNYVLSRTMLYGLVALLVALGYALLVAGLSLISGGLFSPNNPVVAGLLFFMLALAFAPLRQRIQDHLDRVFFRSERAFQERLQIFSGELTNLVDLPAILRLLRHNVEQTLQPARMHLFLFDPLTEQYSAVPDDSGEPTSDLIFKADSALVHMLHNHNGALFLGRVDRLPLSLQSDQGRIRLLDAIIYVPLPGQSRLAGWLALGPRMTGEPYSSREQNFIDTLCDQAAVAIERAQVAAHMENRAREMAALSRLAQGINVTLSFDDILELIFAQSQQIIPMEDFHLFLVEPQTQTLLSVFYIEKDERLAERENINLPSTPSLEQEVIRLRKPILTNDYTRECQRRGMYPQASGVYAWMCVPLNAGAETIGVLVAANRDASVTYVPEQLTLLQSVADQAAGAIVKTRLLHEAERRARQLATLNEVTRKLTSTLELGPLLQTILNSAVDILNCEAGSLIMLDEARDELVFEVVVGPVSENLLHQRMPPGSGLAGKAVKTRQPVLVNNVRESAEWFSKTDQQTGFVTRSVLVTPLLIKEKVTGVIEVINRKDGMPFNRDDEALLSAFAAQAAVAIENARLYTNTDQALAARVEELSVMQRIDRELNASLDTGRAVMITLEWAMRQSGAAAGLVGIMEEERPLLRVMASQGYTDELSHWTDGLVPLDALGLEKVIETGQPERRTLAEGVPGGLLAATRSQAVLAIQREEKVIGILLLESTSAEPVGGETLEFLMRLADHASVAISNAQLYSAVQQANLAKSEFVSFVSHELKNPMTSVKGFTELLASGVVGPINEAQANFLNTIRSNIDRMNTLVSDLNDVSKIEANRLRLDYKAFSLAEAVEEVARSTKRQIEEKEQTLVVLPLEELPGVWADRTRTVQVLVNLISNANKYTDKGGQVTLGAKVCDNQWDPQGARRVVHVWVKDSGIGINEADQKKIFQKFFRSDDPKTREATGTGLGLNITKSLVEMQGGRIWFESEFRKGTTFHFTLPVVES